MKSWLFWKDPDSGKDWRQEEKGMTEDEMFWWHHWISGRELGQTLKESEGQGSLLCYSPWGQKESDMLSDWTTTNSWFAILWPYILNGLPRCVVVKNSPACAGNARDPGWISGSGRSLGEEIQLTPEFLLGKSMDGGATHFKLNTIILSHAGQEFQWIRESAGWILQDNSPLVLSYDLFHH